MKRKGNNKQSQKTDSNLLIYDGALESVNLSEINNMCLELLRALYSYEYWAMCLYPTCPSQHDVETHNEAHEKIMGVEHKIDEVKTCIEDIKETQNRVNKIANECKSLNRHKSWTISLSNGCLMGLGLNGGALTTVEQLSNLYNILTDAYYMLYNTFYYIKDRLIEEWSVSVDGYINGSLIFNEFYEASKYGCSPNETAWTESDKLIFTPKDAFKGDIDSLKKKEEERFGGRSTESVVEKLIMCARIEAIYTTSDLFDFLNSPTAERLIKSMRDLLFLIEFDKYTDLSQKEAWESVTQHSPYTHNCSVCGVPEYLDFPSINNPKITGGSCSHYFDREEYEIYKHLRGKYGIF